MSLRWVCYSLSQCQLCLFSSAFSPRIWLLGIDLPSVTVPLSASAQKSNSHVEPRNKQLMSVWHRLALAFCLYLFTHLTTSLTHNEFMFPKFQYRSRWFCTSQFCDANAGVSLGSISDQTASVIKSSTGL